MTIIRWRPGLKLKMRRVMGSQWLLVSVSSGLAVAVQIGLDGKKHRPIRSHNMLYYCSHLLAAA